MRGQKFFKTFFSEKDLPEQVWNLTDRDGTWNHIGSAVVIEHLTMDGAADYFGAETYAKIEDTIRQIDFRNGNVNHYLHFLACMLTNSDPETNKYV